MTDAIILDARMSHETPHGTVRLVGEFHPGNHLAHAHTVEITYANGYVREVPTPSAVNPVDTFFREVGRLYVEGDRYSHRKAD